MNRKLSFLLLIISASYIPARAQLYNPLIDVQHYQFSLLLNDADNNIRGKAAITVLFREDAEKFSLDLVKKNSTGKGMKVGSVKEGDKRLRFRQDSVTLQIYTAPAAHRSVNGKMVSVPGKSATAGTLHTYTIVYEGIPADGLIIGNNKFGKRGFFGDNWPNRAHNWLPCVDHPSDKATLDFQVTAPDHYTVVANGSLQEEKAASDHKKITRWKESVPLAPKVMVIGVADFAVDHPGDAMGVPVWNYVYQENKDAGFKSYAYALQILPFYIQHIGPYPFEKCGNVQSKTRYGGLENASAIFYNESSVGSAGIESLMAHEIAHQWFGDAATETQWQHLWLSEGFATYMTHCYLENKYGSDTLKKGLAEDRLRVIGYEKKRLTPIIDTSVGDDYMKLLNANSYQKGGWVLHMLRHSIGDELFWKGISAYYTTYRNKNAGSVDFQKVMEAVTGKNLDVFFHEWLLQTGHPHLKVQWDYDQDKQQFHIRFTSNSPAFSYPLEYSVDGVLQHIEITRQDTEAWLPMPQKPASVVMDPNVVLLADFEVTPS